MRNTRVMCSSFSLCILLVILLIVPSACKDVAYIYDEQGGYELDDMNLTVHSESDVVAYTVSLGEGGSNRPKTIRKSADEIKEEISKRVNPLNRDAIEVGSRCSGNKSGDNRIDQICSIYECLVYNWTYKCDWKNQEYFQYSNESLAYGHDVRTEGKGDCDDFSILLAALVESVGGTPRIIFAYGPKGGHAYAQVYIGEDTEYDNKVSRMIKWLKSEYKTKEIYTIRDDETNDVWLNLDWWKDPLTNRDLVKHPGGPLFNASDIVLAYYDSNRENWTIPSTVPEPPQAMFSISKDNPDALENVKFDASESKDVDTEITAWNWDFGDGEKDEGKIAPHSYHQGGIYTVTLTVIDDDDPKQSNQTNKTIQVNGLPIPIIDYSPRDPQLRDSIDFNSSKSRDSDPKGSIEGYFWEFGDGDSSPRMHPSPHKYESNGSYIVNLTVYDDMGATNITSVIIKIDLPPVAVITIEPNQLHNTGDEVKFDASGSTDSDGNIRSYQWNFGDGATLSGIQVSHIYMQSGEFTVSLNVTDDNNASNQRGEPLEINALPIANFTFDPQDPKEGDEITFDASASKDQDGSINYYWWDFDETKTEGKKAYYSYHTYKRLGEYNITLTVQDNLGTTNSTTRIINVNPPGKNGINANARNSSVEILYPFNESKVPYFVNVNGKIVGEIPQDKTMWLIENPISKPGKWWPQNEGRIVPSGGLWNATARFGGSSKNNDFGERFNLSVIFVDKKGDQDITNWYNDSLESGNWDNPIGLPDNAKIMYSVIAERIAVIDNMEGIGAWQASAQEGGLLPKMTSVSGMNDEKAIKMEYDLEGVDWCEIYRELNQSELNESRGIGFLIRSSNDSKSVELELEDINGDNFVLAIPEQKGLDKWSWFESPFEELKWAFNSKGSYLRKDTKFSPENAQKIAVVIKRGDVPKAGWLIIDEIFGVK